MDQKRTLILAYVVGVALGDGNLSRPNKRATRLRVTCDQRYPTIAKEITRSLAFLFPNNKVSQVPGPKETYFNISVYSNKLDAYLPWKVGCGTKIEQGATVPLWIFKQPSYMRACLRGLLQTDGSIYTDRGYCMINFCNNILPLAKAVEQMIKKLGYMPHLYEAKQQSGNPKYTVRLSRNVAAFLEDIKFTKC
ncbi:MAG: LAGLIDADG family homing endonuclease [Candidatus Paceibacterota bacterium]